MGVTGMCECLRREDGTWHVDECCAWVMEDYHGKGWPLPVSRLLRWLMAIPRPRRCETCGRWAVWSKFPYVCSQECEDDWLPF